MRRLLACLLLVAMPAGAAAASRASVRLHEEHVQHMRTLEQRIRAQRLRTEELHRRLHVKRVQLHAAAARVNDLQSQLDQTNAAISTVDATLSHLGAEQHETERRLHWYALQLVAAQRSLQLQDSLLRHRLVDIYEYGSPNYLSVLLAARSFSDFVESWDDLRLLIAANQRVVRQRQAAAKRVLSTERALEANQVALQDEEQQQAQARSQLGSLAAERVNLVSLADSDRRHIATQVANMEDLSAAQEAQLEALIQLRTREIEAEQASGRRAAGIAGAPIRSNGRFSWPVTGPITSPFGWRSNPFGGGPDFHPGLDIAVPVGTTVTAAAAGTVIMAQWYGGYGNYILIDNGNHYSTGYGHLSAFYVSAGQVVQRGQAIAASGNTGYSTGPHVHFEIRYNGKPIDPAPRLSH
ncbi:MAG TPA: peptidoglycan DD-metalloendopeptidase family protein [Candidatus Dormibacteraeota bacterium]|nr:peptidoglycan DD-metalloendopeptidase family protein [Candidatus Dormibacteraeota bacterium]